MGRGRHRLARWVTVVAMLVGTPVLAYGEDDKPAEPTKPKPTGPAAGNSAAKSQVLADAVTELTAEYKEAVKAKKFDDLRHSSDYFSEPPAGATPEVVLAALERPLGSDPRLNAYVKWQLLSAVKEPFADDLASKAAKVYAKSPPLTPRPGLSAAEKAELNKFAAAAKEEDIQAVNEKYGQLLSRFEDSNELVLNYRDELFTRLPPTLEAFEAALKDGHERVVAGVDVTTFWSNYAKSVTDWVSGDKASPRECKRLAELLEKVGEQRSAEYPDKAEWDEKTHRAKWTTTSTVLASPRERYEVINALRDKAGLPSAEPKEDKPLVSDDEKGKTERNDITKKQQPDRPDKTDRPGKQQRPEKKQQQLESSKKSEKSQKEEGKLE